MTNFDSFCSYYDEGMIGQILIFLDATIVFPIHRPTSVDFRIPNAFKNGTLSNCSAVDD